MTLQGFSSRSKQGLYRSLQGFGISTPVEYDMLPYGICVANDIVYVTDQSSNKVLSFSKTGTYLSEFGGTGTTDGLFTSPKDIQTDGSHLFLIDSTRVIKHDFDGTFVDSVVLPFSRTPASMSYYDGELCAQYSYNSTLTGLRILDSSLATVRDIQIYKGFGLTTRSSFYSANFIVQIVRNSRLGFTDGPIFDASGSGLIEASTASPNYLGSFNPIPLGGIPQIKFLDSGLFYSSSLVSTPKLGTANLFVDDPPYEYDSTGVGDMDYYMISANIYDNEIYATSYSEKKIFVVDPATGDTIREWTR